MTDVLLSKLPGYKVEFINEPPRGYGSYIDHEVHGERVIYGHPIGNTECYYSYDYFAEHVFSIIKNELDKCACVLCEKARSLEKHHARTAKS